MRLPFEFMKTMFVNGVGLAVWVSLLLTVNMLIPLVVDNTVEGQFVLGGDDVGGCYSDGNIRVERIREAPRSRPRLLGAPLGVALDAERRSCS